MSDTSADLKSDVAIFFSEVPTSKEIVAILSTLLDYKECERASRFKFDSDKHLYITAHALLRYAFWKVASISNLELSVDRFGKPRPFQLRDGKNIQFSLSHTEGLAACAICFDREIGLDIEMSRNQFKFEEVAATHFAAAEKKELLDSQGDRRVDVFFQFWTLKEAISKAIGKGMSCLFERFVFTLNPVSLRSSPDNEQELTNWYFAQRKLTKDHWASLAVRWTKGISPSIGWEGVDFLDVAHYAENRWACRPTDASPFGAESQ